MTRLREGTYFQPPPPPRLPQHRHQILLLPPGQGWRPQVPGKEGEEGVKWPHLPGASGPTRGWWVTCWRRVLGPGHRQHKGQVRNRDRILQTRCAWRTPKFSGDASEATRVSRQSGGAKRLPLQLFDIWGDWLIIPEKKVPPRKRSKHFNVRAPNCNGPWKVWGASGSVSGLGETRD